MLINLITAWKEGILLDLLNKNNGISTDTKNIFVAQSSFQFDAPPNVVFVQDMQSKKTAHYYKDLPTLSLQPEEQKIYDEILAQLSTNKNFYNGKQILLTGTVYDTTNNTLYLAAVQVDYVLLVALSKMKNINAPQSKLQDKDVFKTGVMVPFISKDNKVSFITRKDKWGLRSVASGFLEGEKDNHPLSNLIIETALKEADEEFALDRHGCRRFEINGSPTIASISFRETIGLSMLPTIEFIAPLQLKEDADFILSVMNNNEAIHAHEHVSTSAINVPLSADERETAANFIQQKFPGNFLYGPVLHACAAKVNQSLLFAHQIEGIPTSQFYPIKIFKSDIQKSLRNTKPTGPIIFLDGAHDLEFEYYEQIPQREINLRIKNETTYKIKLVALHCYGLYKNTVYDSYKKKTDLAQDIKVHKKENEEANNSLLSKKPSYQSPLYHYCVDASVDAMQEWQKPEEKMECYIAYQNKKGRRVIVGFVHFQKKIINDEEAIYIAQAGVINRGQGIGRRLMECVLAHYPKDTQFQILSRIFNTEAKTLYQKRLLFTPLTDDEISSTYGSRYAGKYVGFKHTTTQDEIDDIKKKQSLKITSSSQFNTEEKFSLKLKIK